MVGELFIPNFSISWQDVSMSKPHVIIYSRPGCHLCEDAKAAIKSTGYEDQFTLEEINIESDSKLLTKYKYDIPVITIDGVESFIHRVDPKEFRTRITRIKSGFNPR
jgi:glutaredoxin